MKHLKLYEEFDFNDDDFDFEEEDETINRKIYTDYITEYIDDINKPGGGYVTGKIYYIKFLRLNNLHKFTDLLDNDGYDLLDGGGDSVIIWSDNQYSVDRVNGFKELNSDGYEIINGDEFVNSK